MGNCPYNSEQLLSVESASCHLCDTAALESVIGYKDFQHVTGDYRPWGNGGRLAECKTCGFVQKVIDHIWQGEVEKIYSTYANQRGGAEHAVFYQDTGQHTSRSARLLESLQSHIQLPEVGRLLDIGCGSGEMLHSFSRLAPLWSLVGTESNVRHRAVVESICGVEALYTCMPDQVPGEFDLITMVHVLEHIPKPREVLAKLRHKLKTNGYVIIAVPDSPNDPTDLVIVDHCSHFTSATLTDVLQRAGFDVVMIATNWLPKSLTVIAHASSASVKEDVLEKTSLRLNFASRNLHWLKSVITIADELSGIKPFGLFGASIASTWLFSELKGSVSFFVDESPQLVGRTFLNRMVYHPNEIPSGSHVFINMPPIAAQFIFNRLTRPEVTFHLPPPLSA